MLDIQIIIDVGNSSDYIRNLTEMISYWKAFVVDMSISGFYLTCCICFVGLWMGFYDWMDDVFFEIYK
jgi:hypothetical protein